MSRDTDVSYLKPVDDQRPVNQAMVQSLTDLLALAQRGELLTVAVAGVIPGGEVVQLYAGRDHTFALLGALSAIHHRVLLEVE